MGMVYGNPRLARRYDFAWAICPVRSDRFARCAAAAAVTPASAGQLGFRRARTAATQSVRCSSSPSGLS